MNQPGSSQDFDQPPGGLSGDMADPEDTQDFQKPAPAPRPPVKGTLRRRLLFILLGLATIPGYVALMLSWIAASRTVQSAARANAWDTAAAQQLDLDKALMVRMASLERIAQSDRFASFARGWLSRASEPGRPREPMNFDTPLRLDDTGLQGVRMFIVDPRGRVAGEVLRTGIVAEFEKPPGMEGAPVLERLSRLIPEGSFASDIPLTSTNGEPWLLFGTRVADPGTEGQPVLLAAMFPMRPILEETERLNRSLGQRLVVVTEKAGVIYSTQGDEDFELALGSMRAPLLQEDPESTLKSVTVRGKRLGIAHRPLRSLGQLTTGEKIEPMRWAVVQAVDMDEVLEALRRELWIAVIVGLFMTVVALVLATWLSARLTGPLLRLTEGMQRYAQGDLDYRVDLHTGDEIEKLADAANEMAASLRLSYQNLGRRMEQLDEKASQLELIHSISHSVNRVLDLEKLFARITREILVHVPCERMALGLLDEKRTKLVLEYVYPQDRPVLPRGTEVPLETSVMGRALKDQVVTMRHLRLGGKYFEDQTVATVGMSIQCVVPLVATNGPVGTISLASSQESAFGKSEIKLLERVADSLALAVEHGRLYSRVARFAEELEETVQQRTRELRQAQAKLVQTEKFAATGSIAAHIGHEINNPLSIIKNYLKLVETRANQPVVDEAGIRTLRESLLVIGEEIDRIARIVAQLRQVSKPGKAETRRIDLPTEIRKIGELFEASSRKRGIEIELQLDPAIGEVTVCVDHVRQILINLLRNSVDAMEDSQGGIITIATGTMPKEPGMYFVEVRDTGPGIKPEHLNSIFDPFFTTKSEGKGTGLGLSVSFGLAQSMGGRMEAESVLGEGATLRIVLPFAAEAQQAGQTMQSGEVALPSPPTPVGADDSAIRRRRGERIIIG